MHKLKSNINHNDQTFLDKKPSSMASSSTRTNPMDDHNIILPKPTNKDFEDITLASIQEQPKFTIIVPPPNGKPMFDTTTFTNNETISIFEQDVFRKMYERGLRENYHLQNDQTILSTVYENATVKLMAGITSVATILAENVKALNVNFETSGKLNEELKINIDKYDTFIKWTRTTTG